MRILGWVGAGLATLAVVASGACSSRDEGGEGRSPVPSPRAIPLPTDIQARLELPAFADQETRLSAEGLSRWFPPAARAATSAHASRSHGFGVRRSSCRR